MNKLLCLSVALTFGCSTGNSSWQTACDSIKAGELNAIELNARQLNVVEPSKQVTLLSCALESKNPLAVVRARTAGADPDIVVYQDDTYLNEAIESGAYERFTLLLEIGANPSQLVPWHEWPALFTAIRQSRLDMVSKLLQSGADVNARDSSGRTPLMAALNMNAFPAAEALLQAGADVCALDSRGNGIGEYLRRSAVNLDERGTAEHRAIEQQIAHATSTCNKRAVSAPG